MPLTTNLGIADRDRLIVALDVSTRAEAFALVDRLGDEVTFYKVGMELLTSGEYFDTIAALAARGKRVFADLKFFDIPATVVAMAHPCRPARTARLTVCRESTSNAVPAQPTPLATVAPWLPTPVRVHPRLPTSSSPTAAPAGA